MNERKFFRESNFYRFTGLALLLVAPFLHDFIVYAGPIPWAKNFLLRYDSLVAITGALTFLFPVLKELKAKWKERK